MKTTFQLIIWTTTLMIQVLSTVKGEVSILPVPIATDKCTLSFSKKYDKCEKQCWRYNHSNLECTKTTAGCCSRHPNNYRSLEECQKSCIPKVVCSQEPTSGSCKGSCPRFSFNTKSRKCEPLGYGCCRGNGNKFLTEKNCLEFCNNGCPGGVTQLSCFRGACDDATCPNVSNARCMYVSSIATYLALCNGCVAKWVDANGFDVTSQCKIG